MMRRIFSKRKFLEAVFYEGFKDFETLQEALLTHGFEKITQTGHTREGRETWLIVGTSYFCEISCGKNFTEIRFLNKKKRVEIPKCKIEKEKGVYISGSEGFFNILEVQQFFTVVENTPVTYWINEEGEIFGIETV